MRTRASEKVTGFGVGRDHVSITQEKIDFRGLLPSVRTEAPIILTNSKAPEIPTVFWLGFYLSDSKKKDYESHK